MTFNVTSFVKHFQLVFIHVSYVSSSSAGLTRIREVKAGYHKAVNSEEHC